MKASKKCIELIKHFEGFSSIPYLCPADVPTIGFGTTIYGNGAKVKLTDPPIDEIIATSLLYSNLVHYEESVNSLVKVALSQNQFDALVDFAYNLGTQNLRFSTLLKFINKSDFYSASKEFSKWCHANGEILLGLVKRREAERLLFMSKDSK